MHKGQVHKCTRDKWNKGHRRKGQVHKVQGTSGTRDTEERDKCIRYKGQVEQGTQKKGTSAKQKRP